MPPGASNSQGKFAYSVERAFTPATAAFPPPGGCGRSGINIFRTFIFERKAKRSIRCSRGGENAAVAGVNARSTVRFGAIVFSIGAPPEPLLKPAEAKYS